MDEGKIYDDCHTFTPPTEGEGETLIATVTFDGDAVKMKVKNGEETAYSLNENKPLETFFAHTFKLKANQDPDPTSTTSFSENNCRGDKYEMHPDDAFHTPHIHSIQQSAKRFAD